MLLALKDLLGVKRMWNGELLSTPFGCLTTKMSVAPFLSTFVRKTKYYVGSHWLSITKNTLIAYL